MSVIVPASETVWQRVLAWIERIGGDPADDTDLALKKRLLVSLSFAVIPAAALWSAIYFAAGAPLAGLVPGTYAVVAPLNIVLFGRTRRFGFFRFTQLLMILVLPFLLMTALGGYGQSSAVIIWSALCPLAALLLHDLRATIGWIAAFAGLLAVGAVLEPHLTPAPLSETFIIVFFALNLGTVIAIAFFLLYHFVGQRNFFQERSEMLLLNILPKEISEALKGGQRTIATQHDAASILFADVVGFTRLAASLKPMEMVRLLEDVFQCFDELVDRYGLEKIKTIGDCYMVASGVPRARADHATALAGMAVDTQKAVATRTFGGHALAFRIGINSGPVVAGVIGRKKFIYDLWGDAVNVASRMESQGQSGAIQITRATYELIADDFECEKRGIIAIKGGGELEVWHVLGRRMATPSGMGSPRELQG